MKQVIVVLGLAVAVSGGFWAQSVARASSVERERNELAARVAALQAERNLLKERMRQAEPTRIRKQFMVSAGTIQPYEFVPQVSGTLTGTWRASGNGTGGADDTINPFRLTDPADSIVESSEPHASSGRFMVKVSGGGAYTFFFDNTGLFRTSARRIFLDGEFRPD